MRKTALFAGLVLGLMLLMLVLRPDRSVGLATALLENGGLYILSEAEHDVFAAALDAMLDESPEAAFSINAPYQTGQLNVYVVDVPDNPTSDWSHGNAAYAGGSDVLFVDAAYFRHGDARVLETHEDDLSNAVLAPLRFGAFFIVAHELGHRQQHQSNRWHRLLTAAQDREREADQLALQTLQRLYQIDALIDLGVVAQPTSELASLTNDVPTPLQHIADHLSYSVTFLSEDIFDGAFPLLSESPSHPQYLARLIALLDVVEGQAEAESDEDALRSIRRARSAVMPAETLLSWQPTEIVFDYPLQFAYLTDTHIHVLESEGTPVRRLSIDALEQGQTLRIENARPTGTATVRYAWGAADGSAMELARDGHLKRRETISGNVLATTPVQFGDNSCARRFVQPVGVGAPAYVQFCMQGVPHITVIAGLDSLVTYPMQTVLARAHAHAGLGEAEPRFASFSLNAGAQPVIYFSVGGQVFAATLTASMDVESVRALSVRSEQLPETLAMGDVRIDRKLLFDDAGGGTYFLESAGLFRQIAVRDAVSAGTPITIAHSSTPQIDDPLIREIGVIRETYSFGDDRIIVNLEENGAYLIDFGQGRIAPLARDSYTAREQIVVNRRGGWILFRKFGDRIVYFHGTKEGGV